MEKYGSNLETNGFDSISFLVSSELGRPEVIVGHKLHAHTHTHARTHTHTHTHTHTQGGGMLSRDDLEDVRISSQEDQL